MTSARRLTSPAILLSVGMLLPLVFFAAMTLLSAEIRALGWPGKMVSLALTLAVVAITTTCTLLHWKRADELAREAHKWAWFWGGSIGLGVASAAGALLTMSPDLSAAYGQLVEDASARTNGRVASTSFAAWYAIGAIAITMIVGHVVAWLYWWSRRRAS